VDNIEMDFGAIGGGGNDWISLAQDRDKWRALVKVVITFKALYKAEKFSSDCTVTGLSGSAQLHGVKVRMASK
jgi:hypothetical protein